MDGDSVLLHHTHSGPSSLPLSSPAPRQHDLLAYLERLQHFLANAPNRWPAPGNVPPSQHHHALNRFLLPTGEYVTCVLWNGTYYITGTDIVRALVFRFEAFGRPVRNMKKFEEGIFSDLRNLKPGQDACLEEPKSQFLDLLFKFQCIRTQKKQKVFYWFSVPHDRLFIDALERDLKREKMGHESTTNVVSEPALSFSYDPKRPLFEQFNIKSTAASSKSASSPISLPELHYYTSENASRSFQMTAPNSTLPEVAPMANATRPTRSSGFFNMFSFLEGTPTYKQRRKKTKRSPGLSVNPCLDNDLERTYGRRSLDASLAAPGPAIGRRSFEVSQGRRSYESPSSGRRSLDTPSQYLNGPSQIRGITPINVPTVPVSTAQFMRSSDMYGEPMRQSGNMEIDSQRDIPRFNHVLITPDEEQGYDGADCEYEDENAYSNGPNTAPLAAPAKWGEEAISQGQTAYMSVSPFAYSSTPSTSVSSSSPAMSLSHIQTQMPVEDHSGSTPFAFPPPSPLPHPLSAPSHKLTFDIPALPSGSSNTRPRSADSRNGHARRPSTANAVPSATANQSGGFANAHSWRYQPYPVRRVPTESGHSSPSASARGGSPFAVRPPDSPQEKYSSSTTAPMDFTNSSEYAGGEYHGQGGAEYADYASSVSSASESYTHNSAGTNSPSVPFVHMLRLQSGSPNAPTEMELTYGPAQPQSTYEQQPSQAYVAEEYKSSEQASSAYAPSQRGGEAYDASHRGGEGFIAPQPTYPAYAEYAAPAQNTHYLVSQGHYYEQPVA